MADILSSLPLEFKTAYPVLQPPPGVRSNFINPESRGYILLTFGSFLFALMVIFLAIRFYVRIFIARQTSWGDGMNLNPIQLLCKYPILTFVIVTCVIAAVSSNIRFASKVWILAEEGDILAGSDCILHSSDHRYVCA